MKLVKLGNCVFNSAEFVYAEALPGMLSRATRIWFNPRGANVGGSKTGSPPAAYKNYVDVDAKLWEVYDALLEATREEDKPAG